MPPVGTYRVGPSDFFTAADLASDAAALDAQIKGLDALLQDAPAAPEAWFDAWNVYYAKWWKFFKDHFGGWFDNWVTAFNDSNRDELISFEQQFETWAAQAAEYKAQLPDGSRIGPRTKSGDSLDNHLAGLGLPSLNTIALVAGIVAGGVVLWKAVK
jgi:hypothetical protein